jgi:hypothetical protein
MSVFLYKSLKNKSTKTVLAIKVEKKIKKKLFCVKEG